MNSTPARSALHVHLGHRIAHLVAIDTQITPDSPQTAVHGVRFGPIRELEDFVAYALDETHGDASGYLMAGEMQGKDELWFDIDPATFTKACEQGAIVAGLGQPFAGFAYRGDGVVLARIAPDALLSLADMPAGEG